MHMYVYVLTCDTTKPEVRVRGRKAHRPAQVPKYDYEKLHPKLARVAKAAAEAPGVKEYLEKKETCYLEANPMNI